MYVFLDSKRLSVISIPSRTIHVQNTKKNCKKIREGKLGIASRTKLKTEAVSSLHRSALGNAHHTQRQRCDALLPGYAHLSMASAMYPVYTWDPRICCTQKFSSILQELSPSYRKSSNSKLVHHHHMTGVFPISQSILILD